MSGLPRVRRRPPTSWWRSRSCVSFAWQSNWRQGMFNTCDEPGVAREVMTYSAAPEPTSQLRGFVPQRGKLTGIDVSTLRQGTQVVVDTQNSCYRLVMRDGCVGDALVEGGGHFPRETTARIEGSTLEGSLLKIGWIGVGLFLELSFGDK